jgi:hypothetical protein
MSNRQINGCLLVFAIVVLGLCGLIGHFLPKTPPTPIETHLGDYLNISPIESQDVAYPNLAYIVGKIVIVDLNEKKLSGINGNSALDSIRANKPEEVGTIIWIEAGSKGVGQYTDGAYALQDYYTVTIIDKSANMILAKKVIEGPPPPSGKTYFGNASGGLPDDADVVKYILSINRQ